MTNNAMNCVKAIGLGIAAGVAAGAVCKCVSNHRRSFKYRAKHAAGMMEDLLENMMYMFK